VNATQNHISVNNSILCFVCVCKVVTRKKRRRLKTVNQPSKSSVSHTKGTETFSLPTDAHNVKKHRVIKTF